MGCAHSTSSDGGQPVDLSGPSGSAGNSSFTIAEEPGHNRGKPIRDSVMDEGRGRSSDTAAVPTPVTSTTTRREPHSRSQESNQRARNSGSRSSWERSCEERNHGSVEIPGQLSPSEEMARGSNSASRVGVDTLSSIRSSFAVDVCPNNSDGPVGPQALKTLNTHARLQQEPSVVPDGSCRMAFQPPAQLLASYQALGIVPPDMPVPLTMLATLWRQPSPDAARAVAHKLRDLGVMRIASLEDGSAWCLVAPHHLQACQDSYAELLPGYHAALLDGYTCNGALKLKDVADDGYFMQAVAHHLVHANRLELLHGLLCEPLWLEAKLHAYGIAPVVADFRKYLSRREDADIKLLLQALQLSLGCCMDQPTAKMLREQMLGRLIAVAHSEEAAEAACKAAARGAKGPGLTGSSLPSCPDTPVTTGPLPDISTGSLGITTRSSAPRNSNLATLARLKQWYEAQAGQVQADMCLAAGYALVHLLPRSASLKQAGGLQRMTLRGHKGPVRQVVISPNGADVITVSEDGTAQMWDMNVGDCVMQLARDQPLTAVAVAPGGSLACVACGDGNSCVWQLSSGKVLHVLQGHSAKVNAVSIDRQGLRCVTTSDDHTVRVWNLVSGCCEQVLQGHGVAAYGVVFDVAISADGSLAATVSEDFSCRVWDLDSEEGLHVLEGHSGWVMSVSFIGTKTDIVTASHDGTARVWDGHLGRCLHVLSGHSGRLNRVCVDPGGSYAITCSDDSTARVWDLDTGHCMSVLQGHGAWVSDAVITRDGRKAVTVGGDGLGRVWDVATGQLQLLLEGHSGPIRSVVMTSRGRFAVTASDDCSARVWDLLAPMPRPDRPQQQGSRVKALAPLPGGSQVVVACEDGRLSCWQAGSGVMEWRSGPEGHTSSIQYLGVCNSSGKVVTGSGDRRVCCWEAGSGRALYGLQEQQGSRVKHMAFNADVSRVAIVLYDSSISVWEVESGTLVAQLMGRAERSGRNVHSGGVNGVLLTADGRRAVSWSKDCTARVWDVDSCQVSLVLSGHQDGLRCAALSSDESMVATASYLPCVRIHNLLDGSPLAALDHEAPATACCFSPSTSHLAVVLDNFQVVLWDLVGHRCLPPLAAHKADVTAVTFSPDSSMLVSCSMDCTVRVWDTAAGRQLAFFMGDAALTSLCFAGFPYADIIVAGDAGGCLHFLDCPPELQPLNCQNY